MSRYIALNFGCVPSVPLATEASEDSFASLNEDVTPDEERRLQSYHPPCEDSAPAPEDAEENPPDTLKMPRAAQRRLVANAFAADDDITEVSIPSSALRAR